MLQSAKNLVNFVKSVNPNKEAVVRLAIGYDLEVDALFYFHRGNGKEIFAKLITKGKFRVESDESYYRLEGKFEGYDVKAVFEITRDADLVQLERADPKAEYPELAKQNPFCNYMTPEEWEKFIANLDKMNHRDAKEYFKWHNNDSFRDLIGAGFAWSETEEGADYWIEISKRTSPIV
jgi:hypothetical protein